MELVNVLRNLYVAQNKEELFDSLCTLQFFVESNENKIFFQEQQVDNGKNFFILKNDYTLFHINKIFENQYFIKSVFNILKYQRDYKDLKSVPKKILDDGYFVNLFLNSSFYFITLYSIYLKQTNIDYISKCFWVLIKKLEEKYSFEFTKIDILNIFEIIIFDRQYFYNKDFCLKINSENFYNNFKKSRLIIGNCITDLSAPILLSNTFKGIVAIKKMAGNTFSSRDSSNRLQSVLKRFNSLKEAFEFSELDEKGQRDTNNFKYYFEKGESKKILMLINLVFDGLGDFSEDKILKKINNSENLINEIKNFFYTNYSIFPEYSGPKNKTSQWSNKSFLNTIKFLTTLDVIKKSDNIKWKIDIFLKCFSDWIYDLHENINFFSELDDYEKIVNFLRIGENNIIEFKSTLGLPIEPYTEADFYIKKKSIVEKIAKTILAMANSDGGNIFIGVIEKIERVSEYIKPHICERDGISFLDVKFTLKEEKEDLDSKRLLLQQLLKNLTKEKLDFLDSLFSVNFYKIFIETKGEFIEIIRIEVKKSDHPIFIIKEDNWITLPKRLNGRVEMINPADDFYGK